MNDNSFFSLFLLGVALWGLSQIFGTGFVNSIVGGLQSLHGTDEYSTEVIIEPPDFYNEEFINSSLLSIEDIPLSEDEDSVPEYDRDDWRHWDNFRSSCWTIREEVLFRQNTGEAELRDREGNRTEEISEACEITSGEWLDPYTGEIFVNPQDLDIDHLVPLGEAHNSGGYSWDEETKRDYANSLDFPQHLIAVSASANRSKGASDPAQWMPDNTAFECQYVAFWIDVKNEWGLSMDEEERNFTNEVLTECVE